MTQKYGRCGCCVCRSREGSRVSLGLHSTNTQGCPSTSCIVFVGFEPRSCSVAQMGFRFKILLLQPPGVLESHTSMTVPTSHGSSGIFTFYSFNVHISGWPQTPRHPRNPIYLFNLIVHMCVGGSHLHTTHSGFLVCCWLGHLLLIQCEFTEVRGVSEQRHGCALRTGPVLEGTAALSKHFIRKEARSPRCRQEAWDTIPLPYDQRSCPWNKGSFSFSFHKGCVEMT